MRPTKNYNFTDNGLIDKNGNFLSCEFREHIKTVLANSEKGPFVSLHLGAVAEFEAFFTSSHTKPTRKQFETLVAWCAFQKEKFEDVIIRPEPWKEFLND